ncbi:MAG: hypothetical protein FJY37_08585 [Betaproteobacteria bacterium]|nr:hypothetical protein [Betaproteobacteria bacterium]
MRVHTWLYVAPLLCGLWAGVGAAASPEQVAQIRALQFSLTQADLEQQSVHRRFQMLLELRRLESEIANVAPPPGLTGKPPPNYEEVTRTRAEEDLRSSRLLAELHKLYERFGEIEDEKQRLRSQISTPMAQP